jgi:hypothetical protein
MEAVPTHLAVQARPSQQADANAHQEQAPHATTKSFLLLAESHVRETVWDEDESDSRMKSGENASYLHALENEVDAGPQTMYLRSRPGTPGTNPHPTANTQSNANAMMKSIGQPWLPWFVSDRSPCTSSKGRCTFESRWTKVLECTYRKTATSLAGHFTTIFANRKLFCRFCFAFTSAFGLASS